MELGGMECMERADYQPVYTDEKVFCQNVTGPKMLMLAWKCLVSAQQEFCYESEHFVSKRGRHMHVLEAMPKVAWHDDIGETSVRIFHEEDSDSDDGSDAPDLRADLVSEECHGITKIIKDTVVEECHGVANLVECRLIKQ